MNVVVVDGQGGGIGKAVIEKLKVIENIDIIALGTNQYAARQMEKAGSYQDDYGEAAIIKNVAKADVIIGAIGIIAPGAMMGEITPAIARSIVQSAAKKVLIPINKCNLIVVGADQDNLTKYIQNAVDIVESLCISPSKSMK